MLLHSPKNFGGTRSRPDNKVTCMIGLGARSACILPDLNSAFADIRIVIPSVHELAACETAEEVANIPTPDVNGAVGFEGSGIFIPGPVLRNAIIESNSKDPFELIPKIYQPRGLSTKNSTLCQQFGECMGIRIIQHHNHQYVLLKSAVELN